jgi:hypothetical protein
MDRTDLPDEGHTATEAGLPEEAFWPFPSTVTAASIEAADDQPTARLAATPSSPTVFDAVTRLEDDEFDGLRTCDTCDRVTDAGEFPDWINGRCELCDPEILEHPDNNPEHPDNNP